ncbi:MAG: metal ABC transporter permease [Acidobacteriia bacterium]|nr:metal ABC transporter permease [Terriglobia bacterium]
MVGSFALMRRMLLAGDVISHIALPGLGLAFLLNFSPLLGGGTALFLGTLLIWQLQKKTGFTTDAIIGVVFAASVAIGAVLTPKEDLVEALFGKFQQLSSPAFAAGVACVIAIIVFVLQFKDQLTLSLFSTELAAATGVKLNRLNLYFLLAFSLTVLVGLRFMGGLLAGALIILPATTGRRLGRDIAQFLLFSCTASALAVGLGLVLSNYVLHTSTSGPTVVIISAVLFVLSLLKTPK